MRRSIRLAVMRRAGNRCEYCQIHNDDAGLFSLHVEHIIPRQHHGTDDLENLCLSCAECNWAKGTNLAGLLHGKLYRLYHPRRQHWTRHFFWDQTLLVGKTNTGIVTVQVLAINEPSRLMLRENLLFEGRFP